MEHENLTKLWDLFKQFERNDGNTTSGLVLYADGSGHIELDTKEVIDWNSLDEGIAKLQPLASLSHEGALWFLSNYKFISHRYVKKEVKND